MDMRFQRTEKLLKEAAMHLGKTKDIYSLSVSELTKEAGINRLSFYLHYENIDQFISVLEDEYVNLFLKEVAPFKDFIDQPEIIIQRMMDLYHRDTNLVFKRGSKSMGFTQKGINGIVKSIIQETKNNDPIFREKLVFITNGIKGIFEECSLENPQTIKHISIFISKILED